MERGVDTETLKNADNLSLLGISGYGETRPTKYNETNETDEQKKKNRRIDLRFVLAVPEVDQIGVNKGNLTPCVGR
jgi:hypothetical protein